MTSLHQAGMGPVRQLAYSSNNDRSQPDTPSSRRKPCPICGRTKDGDCTHSADMAFCHHGSSLAPPSGLTRGDVITGEDGRSWAYVSTADGASGITSTFVLDRPSTGSTSSRPPMPRTVSKPAKPMPAAIPTEPITLAPLSGAKLLDGIEDGGAGTWRINYSTTLVTKRVSKKGKNGKPDKDFYPHHLNGASPELTSGAGPEAWPLWHQADLGTVELGDWILETEGEACSNYARLGGVVSISQPGHGRSIQQRADRYAAVSASFAAGILYLADNDPQGRRFADDAREAAAIAGVPMVVVDASELHEQMPPGGSIDDLCRATDHPTKPGFGVPAEVAIELILEHARQKQHHSSNTYPVESEEGGWSDEFPPASVGIEDLQDDLSSAGEMLDLSERMADGRKLFSLAGLLPSDLAAAVELLNRPLPTDDLSAVVALLTGYSGLLKLGTRVAPSVSYSVPANLYTAMVMPSGGAKSSAKTTLVDNPAKDLRKELKDIHDRAMQAWKKDSQGVKPADRDPAPRPSFPHLNQYTPAALSRQLQLHESKGLGLLLVRDEMSAMLKALAADTEHGSGGADGQLLEAFDGTGSTQILIGKDGAGEVRSYEDCHLSVFGTVQPAVLKELINGADPLGKFARFLCCRIPRNPLVLDDSDPTDEEWNRHQDAEAVLRNYATKLFTMPPRTYRLSLEARKQFNPWFRQYQERALLPGTSEMISALLGKSAAHSLRLAGVLHLLQIVNGAVESSELISRSTMDKAMAVVDQLLQETEAFHEAPDDEHTLVMQHIHTLAWRSGEPVTLRLARDKAGRPMRRLLDSDTFRHAVEMLVSCRYGQLNDPETALSGRSLSISYTATREMAL